MFDHTTRKGRHIFYQSALWHNVRNQILSTQPLCRHCILNGLLIPATEVDHIIDLKLRPDLCIEPTNLQPLCHSCHSSKTYKAIHQHHTYAPRTSVKKKKFTIKTKWHI